LSKQNLSSAISQQATSNNKYNINQLLAADIADDDHQLFEILVYKCTKLIQISCLISAFNLAF